MDDISRNMGLAVFGFAIMIFLVAVLIATTTVRTEYIHRDLQHKCFLEGGESSIFNDHVYCRKHGTSEIIFKQKYAIAK